MNQALVFQLGATLYGLEIAQVQEIAESPELFYIPQVPVYFAGAMNFHGQVLAVLDLVSYLHFSDPSRDDRVIVLSSDLCGMALQVSLIHRIVPFDPDTLLPPLETRRQESLVRFRLERPEGVINLFDVARLMKSLVPLGPEEAGRMNLF